MKSNQIEATVYIDVDLPPEIDRMLGFTKTCKFAYPPRVGESLMHDKVPAVIEYVAHEVGGTNAGKIIVNATAHYSSFLFPRIAEGFIDGGWEATGFEGESLSNLQVCEVVQKNVEHLQRRCNELKSNTEGGEV